MIRYDLSNKKVIQRIETISCFDLEGDIDQASDLLLRKKQLIGKSLSITDFYGDIEKFVTRSCCFNKIFLEVSSSPDDIVIYVMGERPLFDSELEYLEGIKQQEQLLLEDKEKEQLQYLLKKYSDV